MPDLQSKVRRSRRRVLQVVQFQRVVADLRSERCRVQADPHPALVRLDHHVWDRADLVLQEQQIALAKVVDDRVGLRIFIW